jgi:lipoprotein-anchoring transpeptidase ErfK/SrfK
VGRKGIVAVIALTVAVVGAALIVAVGQLAGWNEDDDATTNTTISGGAALADADRYRSTVAEATVASIEVFDGPNGTKVRDIPQPDDPPRPLVFLVVEERPDWVRVLLPVRPNGSTGWLRMGDVKLTQHQYRMTIELGAHRLTVRRGPAVILQTTIGVGKQQTPTPGGLYYIKELLKPPDPNTVYGPYAYGLSGFSNVLQTFAGGPGVVGVHGTNDPSGLGSDVSAGCIRMPNADIVRLVEEIGLPLGVPVDIRA